MGGGNRQAHARPVPVSQVSRRWGVEIMLCGAYLSSQGATESPMFKVTWYCLHSGAANE